MYDRDLTGCTWPMLALDQVNELDNAAASDKIQVTVTNRITHPTTAPWFSFSSLIIAFLLITARNRNFYINRKQNYKITTIINHTQSNQWCAVFGRLCKNACTSISLCLLSVFVMYVLWQNHTSYVRRGLAIIRLDKTTRSSYLSIVTMSLSAAV